jgi:hypothetical protein
MLDVRFALNGVGDALAKLHVDESLEPIPLGESRRQPFAMLVGASTDVGGDASLENAVRAVGHDVNPAARHSRVIAWMAGSSPAMTATGAGHEPSSVHEHPVVPPQVSHFRHVPLRTIVKLPHSGQDSPT